MNMRLAELVSDSTHTHKHIQTQKKNERKRILWHCGSSLFSRFSSLFWVFKTRSCDFSLFFFFRCSYRRGGSGAQHARHTSSCFSRLCGHPQIHNIEKRKRHYRWQDTLRFPLGPKRQEKEVRELSFKREKAEWGQQAPRMCPKKQKEKNRRKE